MPNHTKHSLLATLVAVVEKAGVQGV